MQRTIKVKSVSDLRANFSEALKNITKQRAPMIITQKGEAKAVLQDVASYEETQETLALLKILAIGKQQVDTGQVKPIATVIERLRTRVRNKH